MGSPRDLAKEHKPITDMFNVSKAGAILAIGRVGARPPFEQTKNNFLKKSCYFMSSNHSNAMISPKFCT